jgi:hypothetical protein
MALCPVHGARCHSNPLQTLPSFPASVLVNIIMRKIKIYYFDPKGSVAIRITTCGELAFLEMENEPHYKIAKRLGVAQKIINDHLAKMAVLPNPLNADLSWIMIQK